MRRSQSTQGAGHDVNPKLSSGDQPHGHRTDGDEVYWLPLQQLRLKGGIGPLGMVRRIHRDDLEFKPRRVANFAECVEGDELLSIAVPLVTVVDEQALLAQVLAPILAAAYAVTIPAGAGALGARQS